MLTNEEIADHLLNDIPSYKEYIKEFIVGTLMSSATKRVYWDAWFRGAKNKDLIKAQKGIIYRSNERT